ncbi:MAG TPA: cation-translocating P-type ATPase [Bacteroidales bacterium]|nr:cation-translocating P-type ATPase [Bacteroidales bacterium]
MTANTKNRDIIEVHGMNCTNCALGIKKQLEKNGFQLVDANFSSNEISFQKEENSRLLKAKNIISSMGYQVIEVDSANKRDFFTIEKKVIIAILFTFPLIVAMFLPFKILHNPYFQLILAIPVFLIGVLHFGRSAYMSLKSGIMNMDVLIIVGAISSFAYSLYGTIQHLGHDFQFYETSASIITIVLLGNLLEHRSVKRTTSAMEDLVKLQHINAKKIILSGTSERIENVETAQIKQGDHLLINTGDKIPVDGTIYWGYGSVDESMISGESVPVDKIENSNVIGGTLLVSGSIKMQATAIGNETVLSQIIEMVKNAQQDKPKMQNLADKISSVFVPLILGIALFTFLVSYFGFSISFQTALMNSIAVLVIACPCALGLAIPTAVVVGIGKMAKNGILIKGGSTLEKFAKIKTIVFDKTGTLTTGKFEIKKLYSFNYTEEQIKSILYSIEKHSSHPIAQSIAQKYEGLGVIEMTDIVEEKGIGIQAVDLKGNKFKIGSYSFVQHLTDDDMHTVYLLENEKLIAWVDIEDEIKQDAKETIDFFNSFGIKTVLLSGDRQKKCKILAEKIGIQEVYAEKLPEEKLRIIEALSKNSITAMIGDGINDAPALTKADVGISLSNATQIAIQSAQIILLKGNLNLLCKAYSTSKLTLTTIKQNLFWAFFYNILAVPVAAVGILNPMIAAVSMALSDVFVVANSLRLRNKKIKMNK